MRGEALAFCSCGPKGIRTPDLLDANEARYQLRHRPVNDIYVITLGIADRTKAPHPRHINGSRGLRGGGDGGI
ncbi:protein of unknown function [Microbacterium sp. Nx66]|nr:protein of unknown function [Microbacterium sp. Nx66]